MYYTGTVSPATTKFSMVTRGEGRVWGSAKGRAPEFPNDKPTKNFPSHKNQ